MKFSIRDLLLVTVIVALAAGWWEDRTKLANKIWHMQEEERGRLLLESILQLGPQTGDLPNSSAPAPNPPNP